MPAEYRAQWEPIGVYNHMTTVKGLFTAGDGAGASSHKFSSGSHAEGRIAAKGAIAYILDHNVAPQVNDATIESMKRPSWLHVIASRNLPRYPAIRTSIPTSSSPRCSCSAFRR